ncbi:TonB-dependent receptor [Undibacterium sp.]|uniref:TonB-dependent siderophore receptor n=1 Tax=Undibacterium sp. TaxID=1914977 RepID=UPI002CF42E6D|nr:TonB-dependent receptor [Undibacterium sp.]HTD03729.1 TonB-dependent receptor [Undibacterium sp.]
MHFKRNTLSLSVALACLALSAHAAAQEDAAGSPPAAVTDKQGLQTVTVNGDRSTGFKTKYVQVGAFRDQELLDVPLTVNVIPRALLESQDALSMYDALKNAAGVSRAQTSGSVIDTLSIRGISVDARTNYRLNGTLPLNNLIEMPLEDKERVEALKGSSALYYGFSAPSGIINLVTKRAKDEPNASVSTSANAYGELIGAVDVGRKFGDQKQFGLRVNAADGRLRSAMDGFSGSRSFGSAALDWRATEDLNFFLDVESIRKNAVEDGGIGLLPAVNNVITLPKIPNSHRLLSGTWANYSGSAQNVLLKTLYTISDNWTASLEVGRAETDRDTRDFGSMQNYNVVTGEGTLRTAVTRGQVYVNKNVRAELTGRLITGFLDQELTFGVSENKRFANTPSSQQYNLSQNIYNPRILPEPLLTTTLTYSPQNIDDKGVYVFDRIRLTDKLQLLAGARSSDYTNISPTSNYAVKKVSPSAGLIYRIRPDTSLYATYIQGIEETGTASPNTANALQTLPPAVSKQNELGIRTEYFKDVSLSAALFTINRASAYVNAANYFVLDGRAEYKGLELSANGSLTKELAIYMSGLFLNATQQNAANQALIGKTPENTAKQSGSIFLEYSPDALPGFSFNGGTYYTSKRAVNNLNQAYIPGGSILTAGVRYRTKVAGHPFSIQLNVDNLSNKVYWSAAGNSLLAAGAPRLVKLSAKIDL